MEPMPAAARVTDLTSHGTPLGPGPGGLGSQMVFIGGAPAWRALVDFHTCQLTKAGVPHTGGLVAAGSLTVFIEGFSAVRQGDKVMESGPPNAIAAGCINVLIGGGGIERDKAKFPRAVFCG